ncbi:ABC-2 type transport system ATP-binding protein [Lachnospiraceae bacterium NE2001]|nr:ABC-2 type transport system ATP-binding protein [Lachnospiraceae bacterium NE2001]
MVKVNGIRKTFGANEVLKGVSFEIEEGTIYGLIGRNGAGKTTLMNIMSGLLKADSGTFDMGTGKGSGKTQVGYLPDLPNFYDYLTTDEYLDFLLMESNPVRRDALLETVGLGKGLRIKTMSRGMKQRLGIAAVLVNDPKIILLDEPTSALDPAGRADVRSILMKLKSEGKTIILSTHILADMDSICDKAGFLAKGVIAREVNIAESRESASIMTISFASEPDLPTLHKYAPEIYIMDKCTIKIVLDKSDIITSQQKALQGLSQLPQEITSISSAALSLDNIFQEVCL